MSQPPPSDHVPSDSAFAALEPGFLVGNGRFTLIRMLGRGGMGVVWLARDEALREEVALKFLPPEIRYDAIALDDLRRETARARKLTHPNIVRIHDLYKDEREAFVSMEYIDGPSLADLLVQQPDRVFEWIFIEPLVKQLCDALEYAHSERVVHRDLKPANMMLDSRGRLKLSDFGIAAQLSDSATRVSMIRHGASGTSTYMSPQQMDGRLPQVTDDIYALGATLYELLTSHPPFFSGDIPHQVRNLPPQPVRERLQELGIENEVPSAVAAMIMACLGKSPDQRPQSARAVAEWIGMQSPVAAPPTASSTSNAAVLDSPAEQKTKPVPAPTTQVSARPQPEETFVPEPLAATEPEGFALEDRSTPEASNPPRARRALILAALLVMGIASLGTGAAVWWMLKGSNRASKPAVSARASDPVLIEAPAEASPPVRAFPQQWFAGAAALTPHSTPIADVAFSADGHWFVSVSADAVLRVHDAASGRMLNERNVGNRAEVKALAITKVGQAVAAASVSGLLELFPLATSGSSGSVQAHATPVLDVASVENYLISGDQNGDLKVWDVRSLSNLGQWSANPGGVRSLVVDPRGQWIVTGGKDAAIHAWALPRGERIASLSGHKDEIRSVSVSPNGKLIASTSRDRSLRLWTTEDWKIKRTAQWGSDANLHAGTAFSPDSSSVAAGGPGGRVFVYDVETAARGRQQELSGANGVVNVVTFSPDGSVIVGGDEKGGLRIWKSASAKTGTETVMSRPTSIFNGQDFSKWLGDGAVWSVKDGVIRAETGGRRTSSCLFWTGEEVSDFELSFRFRLLRGNAGVFYRARQLSAHAAGGYQFDIAKTITGNLIEVGEDRRRRDLCRVTGNVQRNFDSAAPEEWHDAAIIATGQTLVHKLDGTALCTVHDLPTAPRTGFIALEVAGNTTVEFKDVELRVTAKP